MKITTQSQRLRDYWASVTVAEQRARGEAVRQGILRKIRQEEEILLREIVKESRKTSPCFRSPKKKKP